MHLVASRSGGGLKRVSRRPEVTTRIPGLFTGRAPEAIRPNTRPIDRVEVDDATCVASIAPRRRCSHGASGAYSGCRPDGVNAASVMISLLRCCISRPYLAICLVAQLPAIILAASQRGSFCLNIHTPANSSPSPPPPPPSLIFLYPWAARSDPAPPP